MKTNHLIILFCILTGCQGLPEGQGGFYTWVDESGNIRTEQKKTVSKNAPVEVPDNQSPQGFDATEFTPSEEIDKKLANKRLYAWKDEQGNQVVVEESPLDEGEPDYHVELGVVDSVDLNVYREGKQLLISNVKSKALSLERYYQFNEVAKSDYVLIELDVDIKKIEIKSYFKNNKIALPLVIPLNAQFKQQLKFENPFKFFQEETWYGYGYGYSVLNIPGDVQYLLILPNPQIGMLEVGDALIKQSNLGVISLDIQ